MKHGLFYTLGIIVLSMVSVTTSLAQLQQVQQVAPSTLATTGVGPYYAIPSWDQKLPASTRFIVLSNWENAAVLDKETGLVWERSPSTAQRNLNYALGYCTNLNLSNRMGWRLPSVYELGTLVDRSVASGPKLPLGHPFTSVQQARYWSGTWLFGAPFFNFVDKKLNGWMGCIDFGTGTIHEMDPFTSNPSYYIWCVRGGQGVGSF